MSTTRRTTTDRIRYRYGMCLNDSCQKCKSKEVQEIPARKDLLCAECGKPLRECPPPKPSNKPKIAIIVGGVLVLGVIGGVCYALMGNKDKEPDQAMTETDAPKTEVVTNEDTALIEETVTAEEEQAVTPTEKATPTTQTSVQNGYGTINLSYGSYTGDIKNGKPHGHGKITYTTTCKLVPSKDEMVNAGDSFEGEFRNGLISGPGTLNQNGNVSIFKP